MYIQLTQHKVTHIDPQDLPLVAKYKWFAAKQSRAGKWYALTHIRDENGNRKRIGMHALIMGASPIDHIDGDGLNNRRANLRTCTNAQNQLNTNARGGGSKYKGVSWHRKKGRWQVAFRALGQYHFVGYFDDEIEAARAYNEAILRVCPEFARLNPVPSASTSPAAA